MNAPDLLQDTMMEEWVTVVSAKMVREVIPNHGEAREIDKSPTFMNRLEDRQIGEVRDQISSERIVSSLLYDERRSTTHGEDREMTKGVVMCMIRVGQLR